MLKSTQDKLERQQKAQSQIEFFENQKDNLKNMQCDSIEDIARKLEMFHSYEDQIAAVKKQYNSEQMFHTMDEARERGEKIAELAEDYAPKTEEERKEEMVEEALGIEEKGGLTESMEEVQEITEEMVEELATENAELLDEVMTAESEVLVETGVLPPEEIKYKKIDILILYCVLEGKEILIFADIFYSKGWRLFSKD